MLRVWGLGFRAWGSVFHGLRDFGSRLRGAKVWISAFKVSGKVVAALRFLE